MKHILKWPMKMLKSVAAYSPTDDQVNAFEVVGLATRSFFRAFMVVAWIYLFFKMAAGLIHHYGLFGSLWGQ